MDKKLLDNEIVDISIKLIDETFGFGRKGTHKKKCEICGMIFDEPNDLDILTVEGPSTCPYCKEIIELRNELNKHQRDFDNRENENPIESKNMIKDDNEYNKRIYNGIITESYTLDNYSESFEIKGRTKRVKGFISRVEEARKYLYEVIEPYMKILESLYERKDSFWQEGGNLHWYIRNASIQFVAIRLKEFLNGKSKYSISKIRNIIEQDKERLFEKHKVIAVKKFELSGDVMKTEYPHFQIDKYLGKLNNVLESYSKTISAISDYRDTQFAHIDNLKRPEESSKEFTYTNIKRIFNSLKIIYDGFYFSIAPDQFKRVIYDHNLWFDHLNKLSSEYRNKNNR